MEEEKAKAAMGMSIISPQLQEKSEQAAADFRLHDDRETPEDSVLPDLTLEEALEQAFAHKDRINTSGYPAGKKPVPEPAD